MRVFLSSFTFEVRPKGDKSVYCNFENLPNGAGRLKDIVSRCLAAVENGIKHDQTETYHRSEMVEVSDYSIWGRLRSGSFNINSELVNADNGEVEFVREPRHVEEIPYYFQFHFPPGRNKGILVTQRTGVHGIHPHLRRIIHEFMSANFDLMFEMNNVIPPEIYAQLLEGSLSQVEIKRYPLPRNIVAALDWDFDEMQGMAEAKLVITAKEGQTLPMRFGFRQRYRDLIENRFTPEDEIAETHELVIKYNGNTRKVRLNNPELLTPNIDVTDEVVIQNNLPTFESIHAAANVLVADVEHSFRNE